VQHAIRTVSSTMFHTDSSVSQLAAGANEKLERTLESLVEFDSLVISGYQQKHPPVQLYSSNSHLSLPERNNLSASNYIDWIYSEFSNGCHEGVHHINEMAGNHEIKGTEGADKDALAICVGIDTGKWLVVLLYRDKDQAKFTDRDKHRIITNFRNIKLHCQQSCNEIWPAPGSDDKNNLSAIMLQALISFGEETLSPREQEIVTLVVLGLDNNTIANKLEISVETVKTHRRSINNKLEASSVGELFRKFLDHLLKCSR